LYKKHAAIAEFTFGHIKRSFGLTSLWRNSLKLMYASGNQTVLLITSWSYGDIELARFTK